MFIFTIFLNKNLKYQRKFKDRDSEYHYLYLWQKEKEATVVTYYYADNLCLPLARLLFKTRRPPLVFIRWRKPWVFFFQWVFGWNVCFNFNTSLKNTIIVQIIAIRIIDYCRFRVNRFKKYLLISYTHFDKIIMHLSTDFY